jgi:hypothetical protein
MGVGSIQAPPAPVHMHSPINLAMDEEFAAVQRGGRTKVIVLAAVAALVGGVLGFAVGGLSEKNSVADAALAGAKTLSTEIDAANATATKLATVLNAANTALKDGNYPENEVKELAAINIPFDGSNLAGKAIGRFKPQLVTMLINYAGATTKANAQKDRIHSLLSNSKAAFQELLAQKTNPQVHWGVSVQQGPQGPWGSMQLLPTFPVNGEKGKPAAWPSEFQVGDATAKRYTGGDPARGADGAQIIPIAPASQNSVCPTDTLVRLRRELGDMQEVLNGDETPGQEVQGIMALGDVIKKQLNAIGG